MVIDNFNIERIAFIKAETKPPLIVDADAPLSGAITAQFFQPVLRRNLQIVQPERTMQHLQFTLSDRADIREAPRVCAGEQRSGVLACERLNHVGYRITAAVKPQASRDGGFGCRSMSVKSRFPQRGHKEVIHEADGILGVGLNDRLRVLLFFPNPCSESVPMIRLFQMRKGIATKAETLSAL